MNEKFFPDKTLTSLVMVSESLKKIGRIVDFVTQIVFIAFYVYSVYASLANTVLLAINGGLLLVSLFFLCFSIATLKRSNEHFNKITKVGVSKFVRYSKLFIRLITVVLALVEIIEFGTNYIKTIATVLTIACFVLQVIVAVVIELAEGYLAMTNAAIQLDWEEFKSTDFYNGAAKIYDVLQSPKRSIYSALDSAVGTIADKVNGETTIETQQSVATKYIETKKEKKAKESILKRVEIDKEKREIKKAEKRRVEDERIDAHVSSIKKNLGRIFKKKKDVN